MSFVGNGINIDDALVWNGTSWISGSPFLKSITEVTDDIIEISFSSISIANLVNGGTLPAVPDGTYIAAGIVPAGNIASSNPDAKGIELQIEVASNTVTSFEILNGGINNAVGDNFAILSLDGFPPGSISLPPQFSVAALGGSANPALSTPYLHLLESSSEEFVLKNAGAFVGLPPGPSLNVTNFTTSGSGIGPLSVTVAELGSTNNFVVTSLTGGSGFSVGDLIDIQEIEGVFASSPASFSFELLGGSVSITRGGSELLSSTPNACLIGGGYTGSLSSNSVLIGGAAQGITANSSVFIGPPSTAQNVPFSTGAVLIGNQAGFQSQLNSGEVLIGNQAGSRLQASGSVAIGSQAMGAATKGLNHVAIGFQAMGGPGIEGQANVALGFQAMGGGLITGEGNVALGQQSMSGQVSGAGNVALGRFAQSSPLNGSENIAVLGANGLNGSQNIALLASTGDFGSRQVRIGSHIISNTFSEFLKDQDGYTVLNNYLQMAQIPQSGGVYGSPKALFGSDTAIQDGQSSVFKINNTIPNLNGHELAMLGFDSTGKNFGAEVNLYSGSSPDPTAGVITLLAIDNPGAGTIPNGTYTVQGTLPFGEIAASNPNAGGMILDVTFTGGSVTSVSIINGGFSSAVGDLLSLLSLDGFPPGTITTPVTFSVTDVSNLDGFLALQGSIYLSSTGKVFQNKDGSGRWVALADDLPTAEVIQVNPSSAISKLNLIAAQLEGPERTYQCDPTAPFTINLLAPAPKEGTKVFFKDGSGLAGTNPITINSSDPSVTIDGSISATISSNYGSLLLQSNGSEWLILSQIP
jgi:hypothetical protein